MKTYLIIALLILNISPVRIPLAQDKEPIVVSPLIGDKLDRVEEEYFRVLPSFDNVQEAIFYLNPDSTLNVRVSYESDNLIVDTLIENYLPYKQLQGYIENQIDDETNKARNIERGKYANIFTDRDSVIAGELLSLNKSSTILLNLDKEAYYQKNMPPFDVRYINNTEISNVIIIEETNIARYIYPLVLGIGAGAIAGSIKKAEIESEGPKPLGDWSGFTSPLLYGFLGSAVGVLIGYLLSEILPITTVSKIEYDTPFSEDDIIGLREVTRYKDD